MMTVITISRYVPKQALAQRVSYSFSFPDGEVAFKLTLSWLALHFRTWPSWSTYERNKGFGIFFLLLFLRDPCVLDLGIRCDWIFGILPKEHGLFLLLMHCIFVVKALWHGVVVNIYVSTFLITMLLNMF